MDNLPETIPATTPPEIHNEAEFKLLRMIMIDSYSPGGEAIVDLQDGAIMMGGNGSGKTSLIRLIPIFLGENPGRVNAGTDGFIAFYLTRSTSYIIFEYWRRGVVCQSVVYANENGAYAYRFIRGAYDIANFVADDGKSIIQNREMDTHLKKRGVPHTRMLEMFEYRNVIQGRTWGGREAGLYRAYVADYSFTSSNGRLDHVDKIVSGMFRRQAEFRDFLRMTVSYIADSDKPITVAGNRKDIESWPANFKAYQDVMRLENRMEALSDAGVKFKANELAQGELHAKWLVLIDYHNRQKTLLSKAQDELAGEIAKAAEKHEEALGKIQTANAQAREAVKSIDREIKNIEDDHRNHILSGVTEKAVLVSRLEENNTWLREAGERKTLLVGKQQGIEYRYSALKLDKANAFLAKETAANAALRNVRDEYEPKLEAIGQARQAAEAALHEQIQTEQEKRQAELEAASNERTAHKVRMDSPPADAALEAERDKLYAEMSTARLVLEDARRAMREAEAAKGRATQAFSAQEKLIQEIGQREVVAQQRLNELLSSANPAEGSLLRFLREEKPDWVQTIAKVIDPALLHQTGLSPTLHPEGNSFYGVQLDLSRAVGTLASDEALLGEAIAQAKNALELLAQERKQAVALLEELDEKRAAATELVTHKELAIEKLLRDQLRIEGDEQRVRRQIAAAKDLARQSAKEAFDKADRQWTAATNQLAELKKTLASELAEIGRTFNRQRQALLESREEAQKQIEKELAQAKSERDAAIATLDQECAKALAQEGVDTVLLERLNAEIKSLEKDIEEGKQWAERVAEWRVWQQSKWNRIPELRISLDKARKAEQAGVDKEQKFKEAWQEHHRAESNRLNGMRAAVAESNGIVASAQGVLPRINDFAADPVIRAANYQSTWTYDALQHDTNRLVMEHSRLLSSIKQVVNQFKPAFRAGGNTLVEQYFESIEARIDPEDDSPVAWIEPLQDWFSRRHADTLRRILGDARVFGRHVVLFYDAVVEFNKKVRSFNRSMQTALERTIVFDRISRVDVEFVSTIEDQDFWLPIKQFAETYRDWIQGVTSDLPPASFSDGISKLLDYWDLRNGIQADPLTMINVRGEVIENGKKKAFSDGAGLKELSSNGLSYLILTTICVAFLHKIRGDVKAELTVAIDEILDIDHKNIGILVKMLRKNGINLVSACTAADVDVLTHFQQRYQIDRTENGPQIHRAETYDDEALMKLARLMESQNV